jgi:hypothetical protein
MSIKNKKLKTGDLVHCRYMGVGIVLNAAYSKRRRCPPVVDLFIEGQVKKFEPFLQSTWRVWRLDG